MYRDMNIMKIGDNRYIPEPEVWEMLKGMRKLIRDQRLALRSHNFQLIDDCKDREQRMLDWVDKYEEQRIDWKQMKLFGEGE